jgi:hypothetical protein
MRTPGVSGANKTGTAVDKPPKKARQYEAGYSPVKQVGPMRFASYATVDSNRSRTSLLSLFRHIAATLFLIPCCALLMAGASARQAQEHRPLGALTSAGDVTLNDARAVDGTTIFAGDTLRTGSGGTATVALSGQGSLMLLPGSRLVFSGGPQYVAELQAGTVMMKSIVQYATIRVRAGSYFVFPAAEEKETTSQIERTADGAFHVSSVAGSIGVHALESPEKVFIPAGQSVTVNAQGHLGKVGVASASHAGYYVLGAAAAGGAAAAAALAGKGGGSGPPVSPSKP